MVGDIPIKHPHLDTNAPLSTCYFDTRILTYLRSMDRSIIHNNDRPWTWIWRTEGKERVFDKILKKFSCKRAVLNIPCQHTIHCICRKDGPTFTAFEFMVF